MELVSQEYLKVLLIDSESWSNFDQSFSQIIHIQFSSCFDLKLLGKIHNIITFHHRIGRSIFYYCFKLSTCIIFCLFSYLR